MKLQEIESKAFSKSKNMSCPETLCLSAKSMMSNLVLSPIYLPDTKPICVSLFNLVKYGLILFAKVAAAILYKTESIDKGHQFL